MFVTCPLTHLAYLEAKHLLEVCRLANEQQVKGPAPAEVCHNDCIDRHRGEELPPGGLEFLEWIIKKDLI